MVTVGDSVNIYGQETTVVAVYPNINIIMVEPAVCVPTQEYTRDLFKWDLAHTNCLACGAKYSTYLDEQTGHRTCSVCGAV